MALQDIRILVAIDFGTTYSGFAYVHKEKDLNKSYLVILNLIGMVIV